MTSTRFQDRIWIQETLTKMYYAFDARRPDILRDEVFAPSIALNFTSLFGGSPQTLSNQELVDFWMKLKDYTTTSQHTISGILLFFDSVYHNRTSRLPVFANLHVYHRREVPGHEAKETTCDATLDMQLVKQENGSTGNPWRVAGLKGNILRHEGYHEFWAELDMGA